MSISDIAEFNEGNNTHNREWTPGTTNEITINIVDLTDTTPETQTVKYFKKKGNCSGFVIRPAGDNLTITEVNVGTEKYLNGDPLSVAVGTAFSWIKRMSASVTQIKIKCASTSTHIKILVI